MSEMASQDFVAAQPLEADKYLEVLKTHIENELMQISSHAQWYKDHSKRTKVKYLALRIPVIVLGVLLPQIAAIQIFIQNQIALAIATTIVASLVALLTTLDAFFRYGDTWIDERNAELSLYAILRKYKREKLRINYAGTPVEAVALAEKTIDALRLDYEQIVGTAVDSFVKRTKEATTAHASSKAA